MYQFGVVVCPIGDHNNYPEFKLANDFTNL